MTLTIIWIIVGIAFSSLELIFPTAFVSFVMGISAFIVAALSLTITSPKILVASWLILSTLLLFLSRRFFTPKRKMINSKDAETGETLTYIEPGKAGRVLYEGNSWRAKCADENISININENVYILEKQGNTLIVLPSKMLNF